jgi:hypothetical protein
MIAMSALMGKPHLIEDFVEAASAEPNAPPVLQEGLDQRGGPSMPVESVVLRRSMQRHESRQDSAFGIHGLGAKPFLRGRQGLEAAQQEGVDPFFGGGFN